MSDKLKSAHIAELSEGLKAMKIISRAEKERIAELKAEVQHSIERREEEKLRAVNAEAERDALEAALALSREQTDYANEAMMAMCKRAEQAEAELAAVGSDLQDEVEYTITLRERAEKAEDYAKERDARCCERCAKAKSNHTLTPTFWCNKWARSMHPDDYCRRWTARV